MSSAPLRDVPAEARKESESHTDRLLRIAKSAKDAKSGDGVNITQMTKEERRKLLFGH
ncbi:hypothetical protein ACRQ1B_22890 [Rhizobium panacihumi]|uniref:hypothetical protein n=1 Tax=Rhizobium panacihumi TaxID=2008450 RepID=UPI003D7AEE91